MNSGLTWNSEGDTRTLPSEFRPPKKCTVLLITSAFKTAFPSGIEYREYCQSASPCFRVYEHTYTYPDFC